MRNKIILALFFAFVTVSALAQNYTTEAVFMGTKFTVEYSKASKTATIVDYKYKVDDREYPLIKGYRKIKGLSGSLKTLTIPETLDIAGEQYTVTAIGYAAFAGYKNIDIVNLPATVTEIGDYAFFRSSIREMVIPASVTKIGNRVFGYCKELQRIQYPKQIALESSQYAESDKCHANIYTPSGDYAYTPTSQTTVKATVKTPVQSDIDRDIPQNARNNENTFAIIIANECYQTEAEVKYALNDGRVFKEYCEHVLGLPEGNVRYRENATLNNMLEDMDWAVKVAQAFEGDAHFIVYYAGHGIPDEASGASYLLPVDGTGRNIKTGLSLAELYKQLGQLTVKDVTVFLDACFSGALRGDGMLASARAVAVKSRQEPPKGKMVVFTAAQGDETAYPFDEQGHGLFTYYLLKKLRDTNGKVTLSELGSYIVQQVKRKSIIANGKIQTPSVSVSVNMGDSWKNKRLRQ